MMTLKELMSRFPRAGHVVWIGVRPERGVPVQILTQAHAVPGQGLVGDRFRGGVTSKRQVTLIQGEHLAVIASLLGRPQVDPALLRRNVVVTGVNLAALKGRRFRLGTALLEGTGPCDPCSRMETALGNGGYNAMRGHGGITARLLEAGLFQIGDTVAPVD